MKKTKTIKDRVVTESFLQKALEKALEDRPTYKDMEEVMGKYTEHLDEKNRGYRDEILTEIQSFTGRISTLEDENTTGANQTRELRIDIDNHERRIKVLEGAKN